jgi:hypothetical protein
MIEKRGWCVLAIGIVCLLASVGSPVLAQEVSDLQANTALLETWFNVEAGRYYDRIDEFFTEDLVRHSAATTALMPDLPIASREQYKVFWRGNVSMFPDYYVTPLMFAADGDRVAFYATFNGTLAETGAHVSVPMMGFAHFDNGLIDELWVEWDNLTWNIQMTTPPETTEVPITSIEDLVGVWRLYGDGWAGFLTITADGTLSYSEPGCQGTFCTDTTVGVVHDGQLTETGSDVYTGCDATYKVFVQVRNGERVALRFEPVGNDCYRERVESYAHIVYRVQ